MDISSRKVLAKSNLPSLQLQKIRPTRSFTFSQLCTPRLSRWCSRNYHTLVSWDQILNVDKRILTSIHFKELKRLINQCA